MMRSKWLWTALLALPLAVAGVLYASSQSGSYICPLTGGELPCSNCCPLNRSAQQIQEQPYICPLTGEELPCEKCCPLTQNK